MPLILNPMTIFILWDANLKRHLVGTHLFCDNRICVLQMVSFKHQRFAWAWLPSSFMLVVECSWRMLCIATVTGHALVHHLHPLLSPLQIALKRIHYHPKC